REVPVAHREFRISGDSFRSMFLVWAVGLAVLASTGVTFAQDDTTVVQHLAVESAALLDLVQTDPARQFLAAVPELPSLAAPRIAFVNPQARQVLTALDYSRLSDSARTAFERREYGDEF